MAGRIRRWLHNTFVENWPVKLLSLIVAIIMWMHVLRTEDPEQTQAITVPVVPVNEPEGLKAISITPETVELRLWGRESALARAQVGRIRMEANLRGTKVGENEVPLRIAGVPVMIGVRQGYPTTATVELDKVIERQRPVHDIIRGEPARGFVIEEVTVEPEEVTVRGATSVVREIARAVAVVDVSGVNQSTSLDVKVEARNNRNVVVSGVSFEPETVAVKVNVRELNVKYVPVRPVLGNPPPGYQVVAVRTEPEIVTVTSEESLADVRTVPTLLVDISGLRGSKQYSVSLNVPSGMRVEGPASVEVTVTTQSRSSGGSAPAPEPVPSPEETPASATPESEPAEEDNEPSPENQDAEPADGDEQDNGETDATVDGGGARPTDEQDNSATTPAPADGDGT